METTCEKRSICRNFSDFDELFCKNDPSRGRVAVDAKNNGAKIPEALQITFIVTDGRKNKRRRFALSAFDENSVAFSLGANVGRRASENENRARSAGGGRRSRPTNASSRENRPMLGGGGRRSASVLLNRRRSIVRANFPFGDFFFQIFAIFR